MIRLKVITMTVFCIFVLVGCGRQLSDETPETAVASSINTPQMQETSTSPQAVTDAEATESVFSQEDNIDSALPAETGSSDPLVADIQQANASNGAMLFAQTNSTGFACSSCHNAQTTDRLVGPGLWNLVTRTDERVPDLSPERYIYNSIINPNQYVVVEYPENLMPQNYAEVYNQQEIYDLAAYVITLQEAPPSAIAVVPTESSAENMLDTDASNVDPVGDNQEAGSNAPTQTPFVIIVTATPMPTTSIPATGNETTLDISNSVEPTAAPIVFLAQNGIVSYGEQVFTQPIESGTACTDCHTTDGSINPAGPTLLGLPNGAAISDIPPAAYIYDAIVNAEFHNEAYQEVYSLSDFGDLIAYLMTLEGEASSVAEDMGVGEGTDIEALITDADAINGEMLFGQITDTGFACISCHNAISSERLVGPGLLGIPEIAANRVEGQSALDYLYNAILHPNDYIVADYPENLMPQNYMEIFTEEQIYDIIAYLVMLEE